MNLFPKSNYELILYLTETCYRQSEQDSSIEFSLCRKIYNNIYEQTFYPVTCRELLCKALSFSLCPDIDVDEYDVFYGHDIRNITAMSIYLNKSDSENLSRNLKLLTDLEKYLKINQTEIYDCNNNSYLVLLAPFWLQSGLTLSIYSFFLRLLTYNTSFDTMESLIYNIDKYIDDDIGFDMESLVHFRENIDIMFLLKNMDKVLGDSPITGVNDKEFFDEIQKSKDDRVKSRYRISFSFGGFSTFTDYVFNLKQLKPRPTLSYLEDPFELWAYNYVLLTLD